MDKVYVGDTGTEIRLDAFADLSTATETKIRALKPNGTEVTWDASVIDGTSKIRFITLADTLDLAGNWILQAYVANPDGHWLGESTILQIFEPYK